MWFDMWLWFVRGDVVRKIKRFKSGFMFVSMKMCFHVFLKSEIMFFLKHPHRKV